jgi:hypothetical protein
MFMALVGILVILAACGQAGPTHAPGAGLSASPFAASTPTIGPSANPTSTARSIVAASPSTTSTADSIQSTGVSATSGSTWVDLPADFAIRTAAQAAALAIPPAESEFAATHPHVADVWLVTAREAATADNADLGANDDPLALVWWVDLDGDTFLIPSCPAPPAGVTQTTCGSSSSASVRIYASDGSGQGMGLGRSFTPSTESAGVSIPTDARLRTEGEAIAAVWQWIPGADGQLPQIINLRLLDAQQWTQEQAKQGGIPNIGLPSSTPVWEVEVTHAALAEPCILLDTSKCVHDHVMVLLAAIDGMQLGIYSSVPSPATATP